MRQKRNCDLYTKMDTIPNHTATSYDNCDKTM